MQDPRRAWLPWPWPLLVVLGAIAVGGTMIWGRPVLAAADAAVLARLGALRSPALDSVVIGLTQLGDPAVVWPLAIAVFLWLALGMRATRAAVVWAAAIATAAAFNTLVKSLVARTRPSDVAYEGVSAFSFPSGHATVNLAVYGVLAVLVVRDLAPRWRPLVGTALATLGALIALSRLYLAAHWLTDVAASTLVAGAIVYAAHRAYAREGREALRPGSLLLVVGVGLSIFGSVNITRNHARDLERYRPAQFRSSSADGVRVHAVQFRSGCIRCTAGESRSRG